MTLFIEAAKWGAAAAIAIAVFYGLIIGSVLALTAILDRISER